MRIRSSIVCLLLIVCPYAGCSRRDAEPLGTVEGTVTVKGQTMTEGYVIVQREGSAEAIRARVGPDGQFVVESYRRKGLPPGTYRVRFLQTPTVAPSVEEAAMVVDLTTEQDPDADGSTNETNSSTVEATAAPKAADNTDGVTITVAEGENPAFRIDLD